MLAIAVSLVVAALLPLPKEAQMSDDFKLIRLLPADGHLITLVAEWYQAEWGIVPEKTIKRLAQQGGDDVFFQLGVVVEGQLIATGGLAYWVGLLNECPRLEDLGPWVSLLYTIPSFRGRGHGVRLLHAIESSAASMGFRQLYLHTFTAEALYKRNGWAVIDSAAYKGHVTAIMTKTVG